MPAHSTRYAQGAVYGPHGQMQVPSQQVHMQQYPVPPHYLGQPRLYQESFQQPQQLLPQPSHQAYYQRQYGSQRQTPHAYPAVTVQQPLHSGQSGDKYGFSALGARPGGSTNGQDPIDHYMTPEFLPSEGHFTPYPHNGHFPSAANPPHTASSRLTDARYMQPALMHAPYYGGQQQQQHHHHQHMLYTPYGPHASYQVNSPTTPVTTQSPWNHREYTSAQTNVARPPAFPTNEPQSPPLHSPQNSDRYRQHASLGRATSQTGFVSAGAPAEAGAPGPIPENLVSQGVLASAPNAQPTTVRSVQNTASQVSRSDHVLWCGNVPADATVEELTSFFSQLPPDTEASEANVVSESADSLANIEPKADRADHGVLSVFVIARSNCAFVNYATPHHLHRALAYFNGKQLRPFDSRCPKMVCRVRKRDDEAQAGVAGQRNRGIHSAWVRDQQRKAREQHREDCSGTKGAAVDPSRASSIGAPRAQKATQAPDVGFGGKRPASQGDEHSRPTTAQVTPSTTPKPGILVPDSIAHLDPGRDVAIEHERSDSNSASNSLSYASTNSSLLRHPLFRERFFILKSHSVRDLDTSTQTGMWTTQPHNEAVLDQAFRNSETVYLIFSANQSGAFYGYAKMAGPIHPQPSETANVSSSSLRPGSITEDDGEASRRELPTEELQCMTLSPQPQSASHSLANDSSVGRLQNTASPLPLTPSTDASISDVEERMQSTREERNEGYRTVKAEAEQTSKVALDKAAEEAENDTPICSPNMSAVQQGGDPPQICLTEAEPSVVSKDFHASSFPATRRTPSWTTAPGDPQIAPSQSASYPSEARSMQHLAYRALIHNLRLDEYEAKADREQSQATKNPEEQSPQLASGEPASSESALADRDRSGTGAKLISSLGSPFKVEWIVKVPLSFQAVRKLRNPWRENRLIKVSRDGTELEPSVGRQLLEMWPRTEGGDAAPPSEPRSVPLAFSKRSAKEEQ